MREYSVPSTVKIGDTESLADAVFDNAARAGSSVAFRRKTVAGWQNVSAAEFAEAVTAVAAGLIGAGIERGDRVALLSRTRYEWSLIDYAIAAAGAVSVPIYQTSSAEQIHWILANSGASAVVVESGRHREIVDELRPELAALRWVWQIDDGAVADIAGHGGDPDRAAAAVHQRRRSVRSSDLATLVYTSGTTGRPKGCELTHANLLAEIKVASSVFPELLAIGGSVLLFIPLAHVFGKVIQCGAVYTGATIGHTIDTQDVRTDLAEFRPTFLPAVPRMFEKMHARIVQKAEREGRSRVFGRAEATAIAWSRALDAAGPSIVLRLRHAVYRRAVYPKILAGLGGDCVGAISGGAPLGESLGHFFRGIGLPVYEGYGMTEASGGITINTPRATRVGTAGRPVPGCTVRIADDGEVLVRGRVVFRGYWDDPAATTDAMSGGWLHTGDLGELDDAGFLRITGRKKEIIVTAGGKNVAPAVLEDRLRAHPLISQCFAVGEGRPFVGALITIDTEALGDWRDRRETPASADALMDDVDLRREIDAAVAAANEAVSRAEAIRRYRILPADFTEERGELTPTMKLRRAVIEKTYASEIVAIYS